MSYIGKTPAVGNFVKLDAISTSSTNTYNLTVDSVAFVPESANHMLVSLNGVIQAPLSSFSVSGSTITFIPASGTLSSSDSIDFIMVYGNVLDIGTPSDATVTNAKTNFVSTSSNAGLQIKGDNTTAGTLQLNCEQNSHGIKLRSPPHSASASYTLTFPNNDGDADQFLKTDGSGGLSFAAAGGTNTPAFLAYANADQSGIGSNTYTKLTNYGSEVFDTDNKFASSRFTPGVAGKYFIYGTAYTHHTGTQRSWVAVYKNGSIYTVVGDMPNNSDSYPLQVSAIVDMSNTSDYVEIYVRQSGTGTTAHSSGVSVTFGGYKLIT